MRGSANCANPPARRHRARSAPPCSVSRGPRAFGAEGAAGLDHITDFTHGEDQLAFGDHLLLTDGKYATGTAASYADALTLAKSQMAAGTFDMTAIQVGGDVIVFADTHHHDAVDAAVVLVGKTLADLSAATPV